MKEDKCENISHRKFTDKSYYEGYKQGRKHTKSYYNYGFNQGYQQAVKDLTPRLFPKGAIPTVDKEDSFCSEAVMVVFKSGGISIFYYDLIDNVWMNGDFEVHKDVDFCWCYMPTLKYKED